MSSVVGPPRPAGPDTPPGRRRPGPVMPPRLRRWLPLLTVLTAGWVAGWAAVVDHTHRPPEPFDRFDRWAGRAGPGIHRAAAHIANLGNARQMLTIAAVVVVVCLLGRSWRALVAAFASLVVVLVVVEAVLKPLVDARLDPTSSAAYPSGHTATAACLATVAVLLLGLRRGPLRLRLPRPARWAIIGLAIVAPPVVGMAMVVLGAHSIVDVLGALPLAPVLTLWVARLVDRLTGPR